MGIGFEIADMGRIALPTPFHIRVCGLALQVSDTNTLANSSNFHRSFIVRMLDSYEVVVEKCRLARGFGEFRGLAVWRQKEGEKQGCASSCERRSAGWGSWR